MVRHGDRVIADTRRPLVLYESGFAPRWYVPRADIDESALTPVERQTFCPYKGLCSYYDIGDAHLAAWSYPDAYAEVGRISNLVSFEPEVVSVQLDGTQLHLEPGQRVIPHGPDRDLTIAEALRPGADAGNRHECPQESLYKVNLPYGFSSVKLLAVTPTGAKFGPVGYEVNLLYLACIAALIIGGSGPFAVDGLIGKRLGRAGTRQIDS